MSRYAWLSRIVRVVRNTVPDEIRTTVRIYRAYLK